MTSALRLLAPAASRRRRPSHTQLDPFVPKTEDAFGEIARFLQMYLASQNVQRVFDCRRANLKREPTYDPKYLKAGDARATRDPCCKRLRQGSEPGIRGRPWNDAI